MCRCVLSVELRVFVCSCIIEAPINSVRNSVDLKRNARAHGNGLTKQLVRHCLAVRSGPISSCLLDEWKLLTEPAENVLNTSDGGRLSGGVDVLPRSRCEEITTHIDLEVRCSLLLFCWWIVVGATESPRRELLGGYCWRAHTALMQINGERM